MYSRVQDLVVRGQYEALSFRAFAGGNVFMLESAKVLMRSHEGPWEGERVILVFLYPVPCTLHPVNDYEWLTI